MSVKMHQIGDKVVWSETEESIVVQISGRGEGWQRGALLVWTLMLLSLAVAVVAYVQSYPVSNEVRVVCFVYLAFCAYFGWKSTLAFLWRTWGKEMIKISADGIQVKRDIKGYGKATRYFKDNIKKLEVIQPDDRSFGSVYSKSFWVIKGESIIFENLGKTVRIANQIPFESAKQIRKLMLRKMK